MEEKTLKLCKNECGNPVATGPGSKGLFCGRSCSASYNNRKFPKRKPEHVCKSCSNAVNAQRRYCSNECREVGRLRNANKRAGSNVYSKRSSRSKADGKDLCSCGNVKMTRSISCKKCASSLYLQTTLGELRDLATRDAQVYNTLRGRSRSLARKQFVMACGICGYDFHVDVCHIVGLSTLPDETTVEDATGVNNFVLLCRNHHWELDHNALDIDTVPRPIPIAPPPGFEPE